MAQRRSAMDYESMATTMDADPLEDSQVDKARRTVASQAHKYFPDDDAKAADYAYHVMMMLGIHSSQDDDRAPELPPNNLFSNK